MGIAPVPAGKEMVPSCTHFQQKQCHLRWTVEKPYFLDNLIGHDTGNNNNS